MTEEEIRNRLRVFICTELLRNPPYPLTDDEPLITGGLIDSMSLVRLGVFVETAFHIYIPDTDLTVEKMDTLSQITDRVMEELQR
jgi:acyl carrier protein